jgi:hypothetical protein
VAEIEQALLEEVQILNHVIVVQVMTQVGPMIWLKRSNFVEM